MSLPTKPHILSQHESHQGLINALKPLPRKAVVRFGSLEEFDAEWELNPKEGIMLCKDKVQMKRRFIDIGVPSPEFYNLEHDPTWYYPVILKKRQHSGGKGMRKVENVDQLERYLRGKNKDDYYLEAYQPITREFRIHTSSWLEKEFFSVEKVPRGDPSWIFNLESCIYKQDFKKPPLWELMSANARLAVKYLDLDFGAVDIGYNEETQTFQIWEVNSAPGLGLNTRKAYLKTLNQLFTIKYLH